MPTVWLCYSRRSRRSLRAKIRQARKILSLHRAHRRRYLKMRTHLAAIRRSYHAWALLLRKHGWRFLAHSWWSPQEMAGMEAAPRSYEIFTPPAWLGWLAQRQGASL